MDAAGSDGSRPPTAADSTIVRAPRPCAIRDVIDASAIG